MSNQFFHWESKYHLQIQQMDDEHRTLVKLMNEIYEMNSQKKDFNAIFSKIQELGRWTVLHFKNEEAYFSKIPYSNIETHKAIHKELLAKLDQHVKTIQTNKSIPDTFLMFLKVWLSAHILRIDKSYTEVTHFEAI